MYCICIVFVFVFNSTIFPLKLWLFQEKPSVKLPADKPLSASSPEDTLSPDEEDSKVASPPVASSPPRQGSALEVATSPESKDGVGVSESSMDCLYIVLV